MKTTRETFEERVARMTREGNKRFDAASPVMRKMIIAFDVLEQLRLGFYEAQRGFYVRAVFTEDMPGGHLPGALQISYLPEVVCRVCGIGGCFVSMVAKMDHAPNVNRANFAWGEESRTMRKTLRNVFTSTELANIESAFEGQRFGRPYARAIRWWSPPSFRTDDDAADCLSAIMANILEHGTFNVSVPPVYDARARWAKGKAVRQQVEAILP